MQLTTQRYKRIATWLLIVIVLVLCSIQTKVTPYQLIVGLPQMGSLLQEMIPPDWSYVPTIWGPMLETIQIAIVGTTLGGIIAVPVALLCAYNIMPNKLVSIPMRIVLNLVRTVPDLLFASIFVAIFGIGPFAGMLALVFFSFGIIAKLTFEAIEAIDPGPLEAMTAVGASRMQVIIFGVVPQALPYFISYFLYTFEVNIRAASVLGLVGAGGIGLLLDRSLGLFRYDRASMIILLTLVIVLVIDYGSTRIRRKLL
ncbi:phosphonate ABC transporter, permease protein PhnE [Paenibacillus selenitireducens]|uniref:Phosphonate ABC transporter, permease protein PhnE n=2 Tax=Paenibacillus selenitireducens TaxID=1324314 RepID=A0A1T2XI10_9BACL|nr:phosphonate ABC transporter, permease protein PhnE [Paenibacillus selenitireducens]OPA79521.1 phosphonate ABC transporter, permease protein PhnE [Paenibacillus selenitireducens]